LFLKGTDMPVLLVLPLAAVALAAVVFLRSLVQIGPTEVGLVTKRVSTKRLPADDPIAFGGEAGYQADLLMPGLRYKPWPFYTVRRFPWVQVPAGEIGVVIAQVGAALPIGAKSAFYRPEFGNFSDLETFLAEGGQKGVQRPVLPPGTLVPIHPVAFLVLTSQEVYGVPVSPELRGYADAGRLSCEAFGLQADQLKVTVIAPQGNQDTVGIVTALEGEPLASGDIASRLGGFADIAAMEAAGVGDAELAEVLLGNKNEAHNNYQDFQQFLGAGGRIGLQHDPLLYGAYLLNPFLVRVELVPMLVVRQGEVAVVKSFVGLPTLDTSGSEFKFGSIVRPGHRGIWQEPLRTGKYPVNPRIYAAEIVPTSILTLNWAAAVSQAHNLDAQLSPIEGKSREGFVFQIDLQVQIHVPDTRAPKVISMVGTMRNLVNEVLQSAVGNHFRNTLQRLEAIQFIETRQEVQQAALDAITRYLAGYEVETKGVYIQDVVFPGELVQVLTQREIAKQEKATFEEQQRAQTARIEMEKARGTAEMQGQLASSQVNIDINRNQAQARAAQADGEAAYVTTTAQAEATKVEVLGRAEATKVAAIGAAEASRTQAVGLADATATRALGLARAEGFDAQRHALGEAATALVAVADAIAEGKVTIVPEVLVTGTGGGALDGLAATLMRSLTAGNGGSRPGGTNPGHGSDPGGDINPGGLHPVAPPAAGEGAAPSVPAPAVAAAPAVPSGPVPASAPAMAAAPAPASAPAMAAAPAVPSGPVPASAPAPVTPAPPPPAFPAAASVSLPGVGERAAAIDPELLAQADRVRGERR
jgi:regulator of protease activity HflC (stomatin/prohibitin superfamily)